MNLKQLTITSDTLGAFVADVQCSGEVLAIGLVIGDLSTPDITITDKLTGEAIWAKTGIAASDEWTPRRLVQDNAGADIATTYGAPVVLRNAHVVVAGAGDTKTGTLYIAIRG